MGVCRSELGIGIKRAYFFRVCDSPRVPHNARPSVPESGAFYGLKTLLRTALFPPVFAHRLSLARAYQGSPENRVRLPIGAGWELVGGRLGMLACRGRLEMVAWGWQLGMGSSGRTFLGYGQARVSPVGVRAIGPFQNCF